MFLLETSKDARKAFNKAQKRVQEKIFDCLSHLSKHGTHNCPYPIKPLKGKFRRYRYLEALIDKDYRIIFRREGDTFFIRDAGTHNRLRTG